MCAWPKNINYSVFLPSVHTGAGSQEYSISIQIRSTLPSASALASHLPIHNWCWLCQSLECRSFKISLCSVKTFPPDTKPQPLLLPLPYCSAAQRTIWLKINLKTSSQLSHGVVSQHHNTEGDRRGNLQPEENLLCWATSWSDVKTSQQWSSARPFKPSFDFLPFFSYSSDCYTVLNFCYRHKQNQQGSNTYQSSSTPKKDRQNMHRRKQDS